MPGYTGNSRRQIVGVVDLDAGRAGEVAARCGTVSCADLEALLSAGVEALSIAVPTPSHYAVARGALEHGVHVLVEKPMTRTVREADDLIRLAREKGLILQVGHIERFNAAVRAVQGIVKKPVFIESHRLSPFVERGTEVAVVLELMIHDIDIILSFVRSPVKRIAAVGTNVLSAHEDIANARIEFESGCVANVTASRVSKDKVRKIRIFEPNAYISLDYLNQEVEIYRKVADGGSAHPPLAAAPPDERQWDAEHDLMKLIRRELLPVEREEPLLAELRSFLECVRHGTPPVVGGQEGREALAVALRIIKSIKQRKA